MQLVFTRDSDIKSSVDCMDYFILGLKSNRNNWNFFDILKVTHFILSDEDTYIIIL